MTPMEAGALGRARAALLWHSLLFLALKGGLVRGSAAIPANRDFLEGHRPLR